MVSMASYNNLDSIFTKGYDLASAMIALTLIFDCLYNFYTVMAYIQLNINSPELHIAPWTVDFLLQFSAARWRWRKLLYLWLVLNVNLFVSLNFWAFTCALVFNSCNFSLICNKVRQVNILKWVIENWIDDKIRHHLLFMFTRMLLRIGVFFAFILWIPLLVVLCCNSGAVLISWFSSVTLVLDNTFRGSRVLPILSELGFVVLSALRLCVTLWVDVFGFDS